MKCIKRFLIESCYYWTFAEIYRQDVQGTSQRWYFDPFPKWDWHNYDYKPSWSWIFDNYDI